MPKRKEIKYKIDVLGERMNAETERRRGNGE
jgi:hypothetical protein